VTLIVQLDLKCKGAKKSYVDIVTAEQMIGEQPSLWKMLQPLELIIDARDFLQVPGLIQPFDELLAYYCQLGRCNAEQLDYPPAQFARLCTPCLTWKRQRLGVEVV
jgi:hypothetical protein